MKITPVSTPVFTPRADLPAFITAQIPSMPEGCVLAVASKLLSLWKGAVYPYESISQKEALIRQQSTWALKTPLAWLTVKDGMVMTNAGIDESNANGQLLCLPEDCYQVAQELLGVLKKSWQVRRLGLVVTDSMILPLRAGVVGAAVAYAGFRGVRDERGQPDLFGKKLEVTLVNVADSLASACALCMGEAAESRPLCVVEEAPVEFCSRTCAAELKYPAQNDLYTPLFEAVKTKKGDYNA